MNESGVGVIGTPDDAVAQIRKLEEQSGGFGSYLMMAHDWANWEATKRHYELFARYVMPGFQGSATRLQASEKWAQSRWQELDDKQAKAIQDWSAKRDQPQESQSARRQAEPCGRGSACRRWLWLPVRLRSAVPVCRTPGARRAGSVRPTRARSPSTTTWSAVVGHRRRQTGERQPVAGGTLAGEQ